MEKVGAKLGISYNVDMMAIDNRTREVKKRSRVHNLLTAVGLQIATKMLMDGFISQGFSKIAIGTDSTTANSADTTLGSQYAIADAEMNYEDDYQAIFTYEFEFTENVSIWECGIFDASANMLNHAIADAVIEVGEGTNLAVEITMTVAEAT